MNPAPGKLPDALPRSPDLLSGPGGSAPDAGLGTAALERLLFDPLTAYRAGHLMPPEEAAWSLEYPGLDILLPVEARGQRLRVCIATPPT